MRQSVSSNRGICPWREKISWPTTSRQSPCSVDVDDESRTIYGLDEAHPVSFAANLVWSFSHDIGQIVLCIQGKAQAISDNGVKLLPKPLAVRKQLTDWPKASSPSIDSNLVSGSTHAVRDTSCIGMHRPDISF